jgi:hypothetical protein
VELVGNLLIRQFLDVSQHHRGTQGGGQLVERLPQQLDAIALLQLRVDARVRRCRRKVARVDIAIDGFALLADGAVVIDAQVAAHADEPCLEVRAAVERVERLVQLEEDVLSEVFCLIVTTDELVRDVEHLPSIHADDRFPRGLIAVQAALDDLVGHLCWRGRVRRHHEPMVARVCAREAKNRKAGSRG